MRNTYKAIEADVASTYASKTDLAKGNISVRTAINATNATNATNDENGEKITETYARIEDKIYKYTSNESITAGEAVSIGTMPEDKTIFDIVGIGLQIGCGLGENSSMYNGMLQFSICLSAFENIRVDGTLTTAAPFNITAGLMPYNSDANFGLVAFRGYIYEASGKLYIRFDQGAYGRGDLTMWLEGVGSDKAAFELYDVRCAFQ